MWKALWQESNIGAWRHSLISLSTQIPECDLLSTEYGWFFTLTAEPQQLLFRTFLLGETDKQWNWRPQTFYYSVHLFHPLPQAASTLYTTWTLAGFGRIHLREIKTADTVEGPMITTIHKLPLFGPTALCWCKCGACFFLGSHMQFNNF